MKRLLAPALSLVALVAAIAGCDAGRPPTAAPAADPTTAAPSPVPDCPATPQDAAEAHGGGPGTDLWALFFFQETPLRRGVETKIVWRMTGAGELTMAATGPGGARTTPVWGPEAHGGSTWERPGDEWGTGWTFPAAGCWTITAKRATAGEATLTLRVAA
jgi:hypothetical protein